MSMTYLVIHSLQWDNQRRAFEDKLNEIGTTKSLIHSECVILHSPLQHASEVVEKLLPVIDPEDKRSQFWVTKIDTNLSDGVVEVQGSDWYNIDPYKEQAAE